MSSYKITIDSKWVRWVSDSVMWCPYWWHNTHQSWWHHKWSGMLDLLQNCTTQGGEKSIHVYKWWVGCRDIAGEVCSDMQHQVRDPEYILATHTSLSLPLCAIRLYSPLHAAPHSSRTPSTPLNAPPALSLAEQYLSTPVIVLWIAWLSCLNNFQPPTRPIPIKPHYHVDKRSTTQFSRLYQRVWHQHQVDWTDIRTHPFEHQKLVRSDNGGGRVYIHLSGTGMTRLSWKAQHQIYWHKNSRTDNDWFDSLVT